MLNFGTNLLLLSVRQISDDVRGKRNVYTWQGSPAAIQAKAAVVFPGNSWEIDDSQLPWRLIISEPDNTDLQTIWEVHGNDLSKSLYEHPRSISIGASNTDLIRKYFKGPEDAAYPTFTGSSDQIAISQEMFRLLKKDTTHFFKAQYILRRRYIGVGNSLPARRFGLANVGLVFSTAQLLPGGGPYDPGMPSWCAAFINDIPVEHVSAAPDNQYTWGWLFKTPSVTGLPGGKHEHREEWWLELWSNYIYDAAG